MLNFKKIGALAVVSTLVLTGCGKKTVTCSATQEDGGEKMTTEVVGTLKSNKIDSVKAKITFEKEETAKTYCSFLGLASTADDGSKIDIKCDGKSITISNYEKLDSSDKIIGLTKDEFISKMKESGGDKVSCK